MRTLHWAMTALLIGILAAHWVRQPGYMDAEYYFSIAKEVTEGRGLAEPFLWNYLDDPQGLPHPSHLYWMPLPSLISALPMRLGGSTFRWAQTAFALMSAALPLLTLYAGRLLQADRRHWSRGAILSLVPGFYLAYFVTTDSFAPYALFGGLALLVAAHATEDPRTWRWLLAGALCGMGHLTRADGFLLLVPAAFAVYLSKHHRWRSVLFVVAGYAVVMVPWWARNLVVAGALLSPGSLRTLWALRYDELFIYPASVLTPARWWSSGLDVILLARLQAAGTNLLSLAAVNGLIFLAPFMAMGAWKLRGRPLVRLAIAYLSVVFLSMSLAFPFAGPRGGFFHSSVALMPALWAMAPLGLEGAVAWASKKRRWQEERAFRVLFGGAVALAAVVTAIVFVIRVVGTGAGVWPWERSHQEYQDAGEVLRALDRDPGLVAVNNPPGFYLATGLGSVVIPDGSPDILKRVIMQYGVEWVVLEANHPAGLNELYLDPGRVSWLEPARSHVNANGETVWFLRWKPSAATD